MYVHGLVLMFGGDAIYVMRRGGIGVAGAEAQTVLTYVALLIPADVI